MDDNNKGDSDKDDNNGDYSNRGDNNKADNNILPDSSYEPDNNGNTLLCNAAYNTYF